MLRNIHPYRSLLATATTTLCAIGATLSPAPYQHAAAVFLVLQLSLLALPSLTLRAR